MRFFNIVSTLALVAIAPVFAQEAEDVYELGARDAEPFSIKANPAFGDIRAGLAGNPDEAKNKKKGDKDKDADGDDESEKSSDESDGKRKKKGKKDKELLERALYVRDLMDAFIEERSLDEDDLFFD